MKKISNLKRNLIITQGFIYVFIIIHSILWHVFNIHWLTKLCPSKLAEHVGSLEFNFTVLFWILVFISTLFVGRAFCAWGCMFGAYQDFILRLFNKIKIKPLKNKFGIWSMRIIILIYILGTLFSINITWPTFYWFLAFVVIVGFIIWIIVEKKGTVKNLFLLPKYLWLVQFLGSIVAMWIVLNVFQKGITTAFDKYGVLDDFQTLGKIIIVITTLVLVAFGLAVEKRFFCKYLCAYGTLLRFLSAIPFSKRYKVKITSIKCTECKKCDKECLMDIKPMEEIIKHGEVKNPECINCLQCVAVCPAGAIKFSNKPIDR